MQKLSTISFQPSVELIDDGYALCCQQTLNIVYCNSSFKAWFNVCALPSHICNIIETLKIDILLKRLNKRGVYTLTITPEKPTTKTPNLIDISFKFITENSTQYICVQARNMTKLLEKDALLQSHARMIEQSNRQLARLSKQLESENNRLSAEVEITRKLQQFLLPTSEELLLIKSMDIAGFMEPANEVGGDYYDVLQCGSKLRIGIGDVTGHGLESGAVMLMVQMGMRTLFTCKETNAKRILNILNQVIFDNLARMKTDKNLSLVMLDCQEGKIRITGQHEEIIVVRKGGLIERLDTTDLGFPIGLEQNINDFIDERYISLQEGDGIVLYTDGITEAINTAKEYYAIERLCNVISCNWEKTATIICRAIIDDVYQFIGEQTIYDDITLLVSKQK